MNAPYHTPLDFYDPAPATEPISSLIPPSQEVIDQMEFDRERAIAASREEVAKHILSTTVETPLFSDTPLYFRTAMETAARQDQERQEASIQELRRVHSSIDTMRNATIDKVLPETARQFKVRMLKIVGVLLPRSNKDHDEKAEKERSAALDQIIQEEAIASERALNRLTPDGHAHRFYRDRENGFHWVRAHADRPDQPYATTHYMEHPYFSDKVLMIEVKPEGTSERFLTSEEMGTLVQLAQWYEQQMQHDIHSGETQ